MVMNRLTRGQGQRESVNVYFFRVGLKQWLRPFGSVENIGMAQEVSNTSMAEIFMLLFTTT